MWVSCVSSRSFIDPTNGSDRLWRAFCRGCLAADDRLNPIELGNAPQGLGRDGRAGRLMDLVELAPRMGPTGREPDVCAELLEAGISVDLHHAFELDQMGHGTLGLAIGAIEIDRSRRVWSAPGTIVTSIDPKPAGLGAAAAGIKHRDR